MFSKKLCILSTIFISIFIFNNTNYVFSYANKNSEQKLKEVNQKIKQTQSKINKIKKDKANVFSQINELDKKTVAINKEVMNLENNISAKNREIEKTNTKLKAATNKALKQKKLLYARMEAMYEAGNDSLVDIVLNSKDFSDFFNRIEIVKDIIAYDNNILKGYKSIQKKIIRQKRILVAQKSKVEVYKNKRKQQLALLNNSMKQKGKIASLLDNQQSLYEKSENEMLKTSSELQIKLQKFEKSNNIVYSSGIFMWPLIGYSGISSPFGYRVHPIFHTLKLHTGDDIPAPTGTPIHATHSGVVAMAGWYGGYGQAVIIDHGAGLSSLYGHCSALNVKQGQKVEEGQVIAFVGSTGFSTGSHLHFEIRCGGSPVNPLNYVAH